MVEQYLPHDRTVFKQADHHVGLGHRICGRVVHRDALTGERLGLGACAVPGVHLMARGAQTARHGQAHHANAENSDAKGCVCHGLTLVGMVGVVGG